MIVSRRAVLGLLPVMPLAFRAIALGAAAPRLRRLVSGVGGFYVIEPDGTVKAWTTNPNGTKATSLGLGEDTIVPPFVAHEVPALKGATTIAGGGAGYAVMPDGRVLAWGDSGNGLLGNTPLAELEATGRQHPLVPTPTYTVPIPKIVDVATGSRHTLALTEDGRVFAWGNGQAGQLGIGELPVVNFRNRPPDINYFVPYPIQIPGLESVTAISTCTDFSLALLKDGTIRAWGENQYGQLGDGTTQARLLPVAVRGITNAVAISAGGLEFAVALLADGTVMTWGRRGDGLGRRVAAEANPIPTLVPGLTGVTAIAAGGAHVLALKSDGRVTSWGTVNVYDPVGHPSTPGPTPAVVPVVTTARTVSAGSLSSVALIADGTFMVWGALPSLTFRVDNAKGDGSRYPVPLVVKGL